MFAFYLGCVPRMEAGEKMVVRNGGELSGFKGRLYSQNDPR